MRVNLVGVVVIRLRYHYRKFVHHTPGSEAPSPAGNESVCRYLRVLCLIGHYFLLFLRSGDLNCYKTTPSLREIAFKVTPKEKLEAAQIKQAKVVRLPKNMVRVSSLSAHFILLVLYVLNLTFYT